MAKPDLGTENVTTSVREKTNPTQAGGNKERTTSGRNGAVRASGENTRARVAAWSEESCVCGRPGPKPKE